MNPFISATIMIAIVIALSFIISNAISIIIEENSSIHSFERAKYTMSNLHSVINEMLFEATGARRSMNIEVNGEFIIAGNEDRIKYKIYDVALEPGTRKEEGKIQIITGPTMSAYENDIDNDGTMDIVLENDFVLFAIRKESSTVNTTDMITMIRNKDMNVDVVPKSTLMINDMLNTSYGNGYTELIQEGYDLTSSSINVVVNSEAGISYNAIFTLGAGNDFIELEVIV